MLQLFLKLFKIFLTKSVFHDTHFSVNLTAFLNLEESKTLWQTWRKHANSTHKGPRLHLGIKPKTFLVWCDIETRFFLKVCSMFMFYLGGGHSGLWVNTVNSQQEVLGLIPMFSSCLCEFFPGFLPQPKDVQSGL